MYMPTVQKQQANELHLDAGMASTFIVSFKQIVIICTTVANPGSEERGGGPVVLGACPQDFFGKF